jgi:hypothetical protein
MMVILVTSQILKRNQGNPQEMGSFAKNLKGNVFFVVNFHHMVKKNVW